MSYSSKLSKRPRCENRAALPLPRGCAATAQPLPPRYRRSRQAQAAAGVRVAPRKRVAQLRASQRVANKQASLGLGGVSAQLRLEKAVKVAFEATLEQQAVGGRHGFKTKYKAGLGCGALNKSPSIGTRRSQTLRNQRALQAARYMDTNTLPRALQVQGQKKNRPRTQTTTNQSLALCDTTCSGRQATRESHIRRFPTELRNIPIACSTHSRYAQWSLHGTMSVCVCVLETSSLEGQL